MIIFKMEIKTNKEKAKTLCQVVESAYKNKEKLFAWKLIQDKMTPENKLISLIPKEKVATWLFFALPGDRMVDSTKLYEQFANFYRSNSNFFDKNNLKFYNNYFIPNIGITSVFDYKTFMEFTRNNLKRLVSEFDGDPMNIFSNNSFDTNLKELKKFDGYGNGISSLLLIFLERYGIKKTEGLVPKIDRHFIKVSSACGLIETNENMRVSNVCNSLFNLYKEVITENGFDSVILDPTIWIIGHELCLKKDITYCSELCPLEEYCSKELPTQKLSRIVSYEKVESKKQLSIFDL